MKLTDSEFYKSLPPEQQRRLMMYEGRKTALDGLLLAKGITRKRYLAAMREADILIKDIIPY